MNRKTFYFLAAILWFLLSFYLLTLPGKSLPTLDWFDKIHGDKLVHIAMFGILVLLFLLPFQQQWLRPWFLKMAFWVAFAALAYGIAMEFVQEYFIPNRSFDTGDMVADGIGSFLPVVYARFFVRKTNPPA